METSSYYCQGSETPSSGSAVSSRRASRGPEAVCNPEICSNKFRLIPVNFQRRNLRAQQLFIVFFSVIYITFVMVLAALSLLSTVLVLMIHHHTCHVGPPKWLQKLMFQYLARIVCMRKKSIRVESNIDDTIDQQQFRDNISRQSSSSSTNIDIIMGENQTGNGKFYDGRVKPEPQKQQQQELHLEDVSGYESDFSLKHSQEIENLNAVFDLVRTSTTKMKKDELVSIWREQWSEIARIFDRLLLFIFLGITIIVCVVLLGILPLFGPTMVQPQNLS